MSAEQSTPVLLTCKQFVAKYPWPSEPALRAIILDASKNGFERAFKRVGRRVLVDDVEFWKSIDRLQEAKNHVS